MSQVDLSATSMSSGEFLLVDSDRAEDIERKQKLIGDLLRELKLDGLLLLRPSNFAWLTSGGDSTRGSWNDINAALFFNHDARVVLTRNTDSGQLFDREVARLGFQLKERPWIEPRQILQADLCRGRRIGSDQAFEECSDVSSHLATPRATLSKFEVRRLRELGQVVAHSVEATARACRPTDTEAEIAGQVAHRLIRHGIQPVRLQVMADGRNSVYRHWTYSDQTVQRYCTIAAVGRRFGLHAGASRTVTFGEPPKAVRAAHLACLLVQATGMFFSQAGRELLETWSRVQRIYEKFGHAEEWLRADQGCVLGYELCEAPIVPKSPFKLLSGMPVMWHPSIGTALAMDTIVVQDKGIELITPTENWPEIEVDVKSVKIMRPGILVRSV